MSAVFASSSTTLHMMAEATQPQSTRYEDFTLQLRNLRASYEQKRVETNLYPPAGRPIYDLDIETVKRYSFWFKNGSTTQHLRIYDVPGTLSGNILRLNANLPTLTGDCEIEGDVIRPLPNAPGIPEMYSDNSEDVSSLLASLPSFETSAGTYFLKKPKYASEITNYLRCQGGCPGSPSPHIVQLLGKSDDGRLVFPKYLTRQKVTPDLHSLGVYQTWIRQLVMGVQVLHSLGIVHRDLRTDNLLFTPDGQNLVICDLESKWGNRNAPEIVRNRTLEAGWSEASDIWDIGECIKYMLYGNAPINDVVEWRVPSPFAEIVDACQRMNPRERISLPKLIQMLDSI